MVKMNLTNNQVAFEYAIYMIAASYFDKAKCLSRITEERMYIQYKEQKEKNQFLMEDIAIEYMDCLKTVVPEDFFKKEVMVKLLPHKTFTTILIDSGSHKMELTGTYKGMKSSISCAIL